MQHMAGQTAMRRAMTGGTLGLALALGACGPDAGPSGNMSSRPTIEGNSLTVQRVTGGDPEFTRLTSESAEQLRLSVGALLRDTRPTSPEAALASVPEYRPVPRPGIDAPDDPVARSRPPGSSTPPSIVAPLPPPERARVSAPLPPVRPAEPPVRDTTGTVALPGQPPGTVSGTGRIQSFTQPGNPAGGVAIQDGGTTTIIQPGGRVTTVPTPR